MKTSSYSDEFGGMVDDMGMNANFKKMMPETGQRTEGTAEVGDYMDFVPREKEMLRGTGEKKEKKLPTSKAYGKKWLQRIKIAQQKQKDWALEGTDYYGLYHNDKSVWQKYSKLADYELKTISTNPVALNVDNDRDRILPKTPEFKVSPKARWMWFKNEQGQPVRRDNVEAARMYQEVANILALELDIRKTIKQAVTDSLITNLGVVKVGWDEISSLSHSSSHVEDELSGSAIIGNPESDLPNHELVRPKMPWVTYVPWNRVVMDPLAGNMEQVTWWAEDVITPKIHSVGKEIDEVSNVRNVALGEDDDEDMGDMSVRDEVVDSDIKLTSKWEVHRRSVEEDGTFCHYSFLLYGDGTVEKHVKYPFDMGGFCYTPIQFKTLNGDLLGFSQIRFYAESAANANLMKQLAMDYAIRGLPFISAASGTDKKVISAMTKGKLGKIVVGNNVDARQNFSAVGLPPLNQELLQVAGISASAEQMMSGRSLNDKLQGSDTTATEAKIIATNSGEIIQSAVDLLRVFAAKVVKKCVRVYAHMLEDTDEYVIPDGEGGFFTHEKQDLICDITVELSWQSSVREDDAVSRKLNMDLLSILINLAAIKPNINFDPVLEKIVVASGYDDPSEIIKEPENPMKLVMEYVGGILAGENVEIDPNTDWKQKYQELLQFNALISKDPKLKWLFEVVPGAKQRSLDAVAQAKMNMEVAGGGVAGGSKPSAGGGGSGSMNNRKSQGVTSGADQQAAMSRVGNVGGTGGGRLAGV